MTEQPKRLICVEMTTRMEYLLGYVYGHAKAILQRLETPEAHDGTMDMQDYLSQVAMVTYCLDLRKRMDDGDDDPLVEELPNYYGGPTDHLMPVRDLRCPVCTCRVRFVGYEDAGFWGGRGCYVCGKIFTEQEIWAGEKVER